MKEKKEVNKIGQRVFYGATLLLAFTIPLVKHAIPTILFIICVAWFFDGSLKQKLQNIIKNKSIMVFISLYLLYLIGLLYSDNMQYGIVDVVLKVPMLLMPLLFLSLQPKKESEFFQHILMAFISGSFIGTLISYTHSAILFTSSHDIFDFYYSTLAWFMHASYFAMHLNFCIISLLWLLITKNNIIIKYRWVAVFLIFYFSVFIVFLNSKLGLLFLGLIFLYSIYFFIRQKKYVLSASLLLGVLISVAFIIHNFAGITNRIISAGQTVKNYKNLDKASDDGTVERIMIWKVSGKIISDNLISGVGTGDVKDVLLQNYQKYGIKGAFEKKLNAHNQFLQTFIALGLPGILLFLLMFIYPFYFSWKRRNLLYAFFILLMVINLLVESMFETQAGVIFYTFFNAVLFYELSGNDLMFIKNSNH